MHSYVSTYFDSISMNSRLVKRAVRPIFFTASAQFLIIILFLGIADIITAQVRLPRLVSNNMVLQRDAEIKLWGWADPGEQITITFRGQKLQTAADSSGEWSTQLAPMENGGPYIMEIEGSNHITIKNILIGEVWVASGQSNMVLPMRRLRPLYGQEIANSNNPNIRYFDVPNRYDFHQPKKDLESGAWKQARPETVMDFSATAYFFAKDLYKKYNVPIGIINASVGGSPVQAWISEEALKRNASDYYKEAQRFKDTTLVTRIQRQDQQRMERWYRQLRQKDRGYQSDTSWAAFTLHTEHWATMSIPGYWDKTSLGDINGSVWLRRSIQLPETYAGQPAKLNLGRIVDADSVFINGQFLGNTTYQYPPRWYTVPSNVLTEGVNTLAIRVVNVRGKGGFVLDKPYQMTIEDTTINLTGTWKYRLGASMPSLERQTFIRWKPVGLFNGMIAPLQNYTIQGVIWYQGESNTDKPGVYATLFPLMIRDWRDRWNLGKFPFLYVQLANFMEPTTEPTESNWAALREAQRQTLTLPNTAMAVAIDVGEWNDVHPLNKKTVGHRLALAAQKVAYNDDDVAYSGPMIDSVQVKKNKAILSFTHTAGGLKIKSDAMKAETNPGGFTIAGADRTFVKSEARISDTKDKIIVWNERVSNPVYIRYGWANNPANANLYNEEGLPASPFKVKVKEKVNK